MGASGSKIISHRVRGLSSSSPQADLCDILDITPASGSSSHFNARGDNWLMFDGEMLTGFWYPALRSSEIKGNALRSTMLLGVPLVVGREANGKAFALRDSCPHRGMPLSCGAFDGEKIECCYHGWLFEPSSGKCLGIPSL